MSAHSTPSGSQGEVQIIPMEEQRHPSWQRPRPSNAPIYGDENGEAAVEVRKANNGQVRGNQVDHRSFASSSFMYERAGTNNFFLNVKKWLHRMRLERHTGAKIHALSKNSQFQNLYFHKIHIIKISILQNSHYRNLIFPQNSHFQNLIFDKIHVFKHQIPGNF